MLCSGRTHCRSLDCERIDFGHGNARTISGVISCTIAGVARPARSICMLQQVTGALLGYK